MLNSISSHDYDKLAIDSVKKVAPGVVSVVISKYLPKIKTAYPLPFPNLFFYNQNDVEKEKTRVGGGSGFIVHPDGLILTNKHVVFESDAEYTVITEDFKEYPAKVISRDPVNDIAVLKISASGLPTVQLGNSKNIELGQTVIAIGNALGIFKNTVSKGIISGLSRTISASLGSGGEVEHLRGVIQTDVAINQGNSGGPLINLDGKAVGINTAIIFGAQNIGFAIPIHWAKQDLEDIIKHGRIIKPYLGLMFLMLNSRYKNLYNLPVDYGAWIVKDPHTPNSVAIVPGSPAGRAGIKENDIILSINGEKLTEDEDIRDILQKFQVGEDLELDVLRNGKEMKVKVTLEERK